METILLNKKNYFINDTNDFKYKYHDKFNNLKIIPILGILEKEIGLIKDLSELYNLFNLTYIGPIYSSFFTLNCLNKKDIKNITIYQNESNNEIVLNNIKNTNIQLINDLFKEDLSSNNFLSNINNENITNFIYIESNYDINYLIEYMNFINILNDNNKPFVLSSENNYFNLLYKHKLQLKNSDKILYICESKFDLFFKNFYYYIENENILNYDNLIHLCIMVKNGGDTFEQVLTENLPYIDKWTILDTGSIDNTIDIINKVLVNKKKGNLYQEPFINFRESRNRCLDLAGKSCKYTIMLDDTYILKGKLREFLNTIRGDQFADSYSLLIKSDDVEYYSNRVVKTENKLRYIYIIHEVIQKDDNVNVVIPPDESFIFDVRSDYMEERTSNRKEYDLECLFKMVEEEPDNPRHLYYIGQTYNLLENHEKAAEYFYKRAFHHVEGFDQEKVDALFELTRLYNFKLNKPWDECLSLYNLCNEWDNERPEAKYFIGIHYLLENDEKKAYENFLEASKIGYPLHRQYSLKPTLSFYYLPINFVSLCYKFENYIVGEKCCKLFLENVNKIKKQIVKNNDDLNQFNYNFNLITNWLSIFSCLNKMESLNPSPIIPSPKIICFVADGGFKNWSGSSILKEGVGGSETYIIEITKYLKKYTDYEIVVFCNCENEEIFENVKYVKLNRFFNIVSNIQIEHCFINRYSEYIPVAIKGYVNNIHIVLHDLSLTGEIIPMSPKIKNIFCLSEWHTEYFANIFPQFKDIISTFHYGIDINKFNYKEDMSSDKNLQNKISNSFIYSSFPNRGLVILLKLWPLIVNKYSNATLNIFCDLENNWTLTYHKNDIIEIKKLLDLYKEDTNLSNSVINHGWVDKDTLSSYWKKSSIWFYPCKFKETFCLTALEAAISKTFVICNNLAALNDTVGDRGVIIEGDENNVLTEEWQNKALEKIYYYLDNPNDMNNFIEKNYKWAIEHSWENRTLELIEKLNLEKELSIGKFIYNSNQLNNKLEYLEMYNWTNDIPQGSKIIFENILDHFKNRKSKILEIGTFVGTSIINMLNYLPEAIGFTIDKWKNYNESVQNKNLDILNNIEQNNTENIYFNNISIYNLSSRITTLKGDSTDMLLFLINNNHFFDFIYVDASHKAFDCYSDLILSWKLLNKNGILGIDDYLYKINENDNLDRPHEAVNHFLEKYKDEYELINKNYRVFIKKIV